MAFKGFYVPVPLSGNADQKFNVTQRDFDESYRLHNQWGQELDRLGGIVLSKADILFLIGLGSKNVKRIDDGDSPYTIISTDAVMYCDTDGGAITVNLPAGTRGRYLRLTNTGSAGNNVTVTPSGTELLFGVNANYLLTDGETIEIFWIVTENWW